MYHFSHGNVMFSCSKGQGHSTLTQPLIDLFIVQAYLVLLQEVFSLVHISTTLMHQPHNHSSNPSHTTTSSPFSIIVSQEVGLAVVVAAVAAVVLHFGHYLHEVDNTPLASCLVLKHQTELVPGSGSQ